MSAFIVFEGIDGSGKSTQARRLDEALAEVFLTREPTEHYESTSTRPDSTALGFALDRRNHQDSIEGLLGVGLTVVCDRYSLSMQAYQSASGCDLDWLISLDRGVRVPDLTIYLNISVAEAMARLDGKPGANHDAERLREVSRCYGAAIALARARGERIEVIDATGTPDEVHARILAVVRSGA